MTKLEYYAHFPTQTGKYGSFGGRFVPETLMPALLELESAYRHYQNNPTFLRELNAIRSQYTGRPTSLYYASHLSEKYQRKIYLKREDLLHGGAHKINNTMGQALLAKKMGKKKLIAETGAGPRLGNHGRCRRQCGCRFRCRDNFGRTVLRADQRIGQWRQSAGRRSVQLAPESEEVYNLPE